MGPSITLRVHAGIGVIIRISLGEVLDDCHAALFSCSPLGTQAFALLEACDMASVMQVTDAIFETDCKELLCASRQPSDSEDWRCEAVFFDIFSFFQINACWSLRWIHRLANNVIILSNDPSSASSSASSRDGVG